MSAVWVRLPDPDGEDARGWPVLLAAAASPRDRGPLVASLVQALQHTVEHPPPPGVRRVRAVLLDDPPVDVRAWAFADLLPQEDDDADRAADRFLAALSDPARADRDRTWARSAERTDVGGDPAVVLQDLVGDPGSAELEHRVVVARFPVDRGTALRVTVATTRFGAVADLRATAVDLAQRLRAAPVPEGAA